jgi:hypothetical protein
MADREFERWMDDLEIPEFWPPGYTLMRCNSMLAFHERAGIEDAALLAHMGDEKAAHEARRRAGYGHIR